MGQYIEIQGPNKINDPLINDPSYHSSLPHYHQNIGSALLDVGIFRDTLLPSFALHSSLAIGAYAVGRLTNRVEAKDWLWPSAQVINAWWSAVGRRVITQGRPLPSVLGTLSRPERLVLAGVTLWGTRLFYRIVSRSAKREWKDDPRYEEEKKTQGHENFWNAALYKVFLPEALFQVIICLPFTAPFRHQGAVLTGYHPLLQALSVGLFSAGFVMEWLADYQLDTFQSQGENRHAILKDGVWSIVRHPNYLGDTLVHLSFPLMLYGSDLLAPVEILGALANYAFLRLIGGDKQKEASQLRRYSESSPLKLAELQKYRENKNSFWPDLQTLQNKWLWIVLGSGTVGAVVEEVARRYLDY